MKRIISVASGVVFVVAVTLSTTDLPLDVAVTGLAVRNRMLGELAIRC